MALVLYGIETARTWFDPKDRCPEIANKLDLWHVYLVTHTARVIRAVLQHASPKFSSFDFLNVSMLKISNLSMATAGRADGKCLFVWRSSSLQQGREDQRRFAPRELVC
jgi:hypothetical protein